MSKDVLCSFFFFQKNKAIHLKKKWTEIAVAKRQNRHRSIVKLFEISQLNAKKNLSRFQKRLFRFQEVLKFDFQKDVDVNLNLLYFFSSPFRRLAVRISLPFILFI